MSEEQLFTLADDGSEVPCDPSGTAKPTTSEPEPSADEPLPVEDHEGPNEPLPTDLLDAGLILETPAGWAVFKPETIQDEDKILVLTLRDETNGFVPRMGSRFDCHWRSSTGAMLTQKVYYAGVRFKLTNLPERIILVFIKV